MPFVLKTVALFCELDYPRCPEDRTVYACCNPDKTKYGFRGKEIILSTGKIINKDDYKSLTNEFIVSHSFAKRSRYIGKPYSVGALARINNLGEKLKGNAGKMYKKYWDPRWKRNPLLQNAAQALEILYCFERIPKVVDQLLQYPENPPIVEYETKKGKGTGIVEAPRGLLIHHYEITNGLVCNTDIITPTAQNAEDIERYCYIAAQKLLEKGQEDQIKDRMELVVRAFDPCISCSVHMAEVKKAPTEDWKTKLNDLKKRGAPIFIGVGKRNRSDDQVGLKLALALLKYGVKDVFLKSEMEEKEAHWKKKTDRPFIFFDALDFREKPGKVTLLPLQYVLSNYILSHRMLPFVSHKLNYKQIKNSFVLGIQPETIKEGEKISKFVRQALVKVLKQIIN